MFWLILFSFLIGYMKCSSNKGNSVDENDNLEYNRCSKPLLLTPYIDAGKILKAQKLARVHLHDYAGNTASYSGYLTVNTTCNSNMFFWFFPTVLDNVTAPVTLWLQGGPGASSLYGLFDEIGPFYVDDDNVLQSRNYSWNSMTSLLFIDNPVGTGYSFTNKDECYPTNEDDVAKDLYSALVQFFKLFPYLDKNEVYIVGESYAGKYIPAIAYTIHEKNPESGLKINLKGLGIGNGAIDPVNMLGYSDYAYQIGLVDEMGKKELHAMENEALKLIKTKQWGKAADSFFSIIEKIKLLSGGVDIYNYMNMESNILNNSFRKYITNNMTRCKIHVGNVSFYDINFKVKGNLHLDVTKSVKPWIEILVEKYPILFYSGQLDVIVAHTLTKNFVNKMTWSGAEEFKTRQQLPFYGKSGKNVCGYIKRFKNLKLAVVRKAGHMVPKDQPECAYELISQFLFAKENIVG